MGTPGSCGVGYVPDRGLAASPPCSVSLPLTAPTAGFSNPRAAEGGSKQAPCLARGSAPLHPQPHPQILGQL